jgi:hypothetical protein
MIQKSGIWKASCMLIALALSACGGGGGGGEVKPKDLFSLWNEVETDLPLDLSGGDFSQEMDISFFFTGGAQCDCDFTVIGDQASGSYVINSCSYKVGSGSEDPNCNALNQTGLYEKKDDVLSINGSNGAVKYD